MPQLRPGAAKLKCIYVDMNTWEVGGGEVAETEFGDGTISEHNVNRLKASCFLWNDGCTGLQGAAIRSFDE